MKKLILIVALILCASYAQAQVRVNGYYRKNGTYVKPHYRSSPNASQYDNYSYKGNTNPYTGTTGTKYYQPTTRRNNSLSTYANPYSNYGW